MKILIDLYEHDTLIARLVRFSGGLLAVIESDAIIQSIDSITQSIDEQFPFADEVSLCVLGHSMMPSHERFSEYLTAHPELLTTPEPQIVKLSI